MDTIGVGLIGFEPGRSWAAVAHVPALQALPEYAIVAVATRRRESAAASAAALGLDSGYDDARDLIADPRVDLVAVTVKVPAHFDLVKAALAAGKHVYCEWPLGNGLGEAVALADMARDAPGRVLVGTQARMAPAIQHAAALVKQGYIGDVLSTTLFGSGMQWGDVVDRPNAYIVDAENGATMLSIPLGHTVDALCATLGEFVSLSATGAVRQPQVTLIETGETLIKSAYDQIAVSGILASGAVASIHYRGGMPRATGLLWEIQGTKGDLRITGMGGHAQIVDTFLYGAQGEERDVSALPLPQEHRWAPAGLKGPAVNVAQMYALFAQDIRTGSRQCPDFDDAVVRHRMLAAIERSIVTGERIEL